MDLSFRNVLKIGIAFSLGMGLGQMLINLLGLVFTLLFRVLLG